MAPDFAHSRRELRRARVSAALGEALSSDVVGSNRDRLLQLLAVESVAPGVSFSRLGEDEVETIISIAVAAVEESGDDAAAVLLLCLKVLAADGQFARMRLLADRLIQVALRFAMPRPFWQLALTGLADAVCGRTAKALGDLNERLGVGGDIAPGARQELSPQQVDDVLAAAALRSVLAGPDWSFAEQVRERALLQGNGALLTYSDALLAWVQASSDAAPATVLPAADAVFGSPSLAGFLQDLPVQALFPAQIAALQSRATYDETRVIALPTSSGKTMLAELRIVATLTRNPGTRAIYVAPYRLLARQVTLQLQPGLRRAGFEINDLGSGYDPSAPPAGQVSDVIVCTPERLDGLMRLAASQAAGHAEAAAFLDQCSVLVFDELHLIGRSGRGPRFELILARLRMRRPDLKILGLAAATHGNQELSEWLGDDARLATHTRPTGTLELVWQTDGIIKQRSSRANPSTVMSLPRKTAIDDAAALMLRFDREYLPVLAICTQRLRAESLARKVMNGGAAAAEKWRSRLDDDERHAVFEAVEEVKALLGEDHPLGRMLESGIAFHHAGVPTHALEQIEKLARRGLLRYVCATTTVAEGADLPFKVVVIPHLDFPGDRQRRLERDLYLNIIGRAGRANVSVEGMVFILESPTPGLNNLVRTSLWRTSAQDVLRGKLNNVSATPQSVEAWNEYTEIQSQVLAWLADPSSYRDDQAVTLASRTFSYAQGTTQEKSRVHAVVDAILRDLEARGYAVAGSPLRPTPVGATAQLTGLSLPAVARLSVAVDRGRTGWLSNLPAAQWLTPALAEQIARLVFEAPEVFQHGLWFARHAKAAAALPTLQRFAHTGESGHVTSADHQLDIKLFARWLMGDSYADLAELAGQADHPLAFFGGADPHKRVSDATQYIGKLTYPASWVWSGAQIVAGALGEAFPAFIRGAIEHGVPAEACVQLIERGRVTRAAALAVARVAGPTWQETATWLLARGGVEDLGLTLADTHRLQLVRDRLEAES